jgi:hypothetical protein
MKTTEKTFDAMKFMRQERDKLSEKLSKMTKEEIIEYSGQTEPLNPGQTEPVIPGQTEPLIPVKLSHLRV